MSLRVCIWVWVGSATLRSWYTVTRPLESPTSRVLEFSEKRKVLSLVSGSVTGLIMIGSRVVDLRSHISILLSLTAPNTVAQSLLQQISFTDLVLDTKVSTGLVQSACHILIVQSLPHVRKQSCTKGDHFTLYTGPVCPVYVCKYCSL